MYIYGTIVKQAAFWFFLGSSSLVHIAKNICTLRRATTSVGGNRARKRAGSLFNCISVTDGIKINEQNNPIAKGPLYVQAEFEAI